MLGQRLKLPIIVISQLNRNIEGRSYKEPILSDLKESGCISIKQEVNINKNLMLNTKIKSLVNINKTEKLNYIDNKKVNIDQYKEMMSNSSFKNLISIKNKYSFHLIKILGSLELTFNHKSLVRRTWVSTKNISQNTKSSIIVNNKKSLILQQYISKIKFKFYSKNFDINKVNYSHIICRANILHNSIEQDADIIIILYEVQDIKNRNNNKIVDLKVSKNRNGQTGYCQLLFEPHTNVFKNIN